MSELPHARPGHPLVLGHSPPPPEYFVCRRVFAGVQWTLSCGCRPGACSLTLGVLRIVQLHLSPAHAANGILARSSAFRKNRGGNRHNSRSVQRRKAFRSCVRRGPLVVMASKMRAGRPRGHKHNLLELAEPWRAVAMLYATCASLQGPFVRRAAAHPIGPAQARRTARFCRTCRARNCPRSTRPPRPSACQPSAGGCSTGG